MTEAIEIPILTSISGMPKTGKSYLSMTWPEPIKIYSFDLGAEYVRAKFFPKKKIIISNYELPIIETDSPDPYAEKIWDVFQKEFKTDCYSGQYKTLVIDTATQLWAIVRQAITEAKNRKKLLEVEYALPNLKMSGVYAHAKKAGINLISINYLKDRYVKGENTGVLELNGWGQTEGLVDLVLEMNRVTQGGKTTMNTIIKDNRFIRNENGNVYPDTSYLELTTVLLS